MEKSVFTADDRIKYALTAGLIPVSIGWIVGWALFVRKDPLNHKCRKRPEVAIGATRRT
jgi:hypothetical protein